MDWTKPPRYLVTLSVPLLLELAFVPSFFAMAQAQAKTPQTTAQTNVEQRLKQVTFEPRKDQPAPTVTVGGGRRNDGKCPQDRSPLEQSTAQSQPLDQLLTPLLRSPLTDPQLTVSSRPTFLVYVPQTSAKAVELVLEDGKGRGTHQIRVNLSSTPSIVSIDLPTTAPELEIGEDYKWFVSVVCQSGAPEDSFVDGSVRRIGLDSRLSQVEQAKPMERVTLYAQSGVWYDAVANLAALRKAQPNDPQVTAAWEALLRDAGLEAIANAPLRN